MKANGFLLRPPSPSALLAGAPLHGSLSRPGASPPFTQVLAGKLNPLTTPTARAAERARA